jgi:hypothetical protein
MSISIDFIRQNNIQDFNKLPAPLSTKKYKADLGYTTKPYLTTTKITQNDVKYFDNINQHASKLI